MLTYTLDKQAGLSLYEQLYRRVKADILSGRLAAGEKLPSKRALAAHLEVSVITVKNAYEQLMAEGYLTGVEKKGYFVSAVLPSPAAVPASPEQPPPPTRFSYYKISYFQFCYGCNCYSGYKDIRNYLYILCFFIFPKDLCELLYFILGVSIFSISIFLPHTFTFLYHSSPHFGIHSERVACQN